MNWRQWTCIVMLGCFPLSVCGQKPSVSSADDKLRFGIEQFERGQYEEAIEALSQGYALDPRPEFLYALGQSERRRGNCVKALEHYKAFLATSPAERQAEAARAHIERCERVVEDQMRTAPVGTPGEVADARSADGAGRTPWYRDWVGGALCGAGLVSAGLGGMFLLQAGSAVDGKTTYAQHETAVDDGKSKQVLGTALLIAGGGLFVGGVLRYLLHDRTAKGPAKSARGEGKGAAKAVVTPTTIGQGRGFAVAVSGVF